MKLGAVWALCVLVAILGYGRDANTLVDERRNGRLKLNQRTRLKRNWDELASVLKGGPQVARGKANPLSVPRGRVLGVL